jgi:hypothetical protein
MTKFAKYINATVEAEKSTPLFDTSTDTRPAEDMAGATQLISVLLMNVAPTRRVSKRQLSVDVFRKPVPDSVMTLPPPTQSLLGVTLRSTSLR